MTPTNFFCGLLEHRLKEAQPQTVKVGSTYQGDFSASSRVPFIRLAGHWLADAGFSEGDVMQVSVAHGEIRLRRQESSCNDENGQSERPKAPVKPGESKRLRI
jgi:Toxin SymE, type I toxin-antitoxin system